MTNYSSCHLSHITCILQYILRMTACYAQDYWRKIVQYMASFEIFVGRCSQELAQRPPNGPVEWLFCLAGYARDTTPAADRFRPPEARDVCGRVRGKWSDATARTVHGPRQPYKPSTCTTRLHYGHPNKIRERGPCTTIWEQPFIALPSNCPRLLFGPSPSSTREGGTMAAGWQQAARRRTVAARPG